MRVMPSRSMTPRKRSRATDPATLLLRTLAIFVCSLVVLPLVASEPLSAWATIYWFALAAMAWIGLKISPLLVTYRRASPQWNLLATLTRVTSVACIGVFLLAVDRFVLRGAPLSFEIIQVREAIEEGGTGVVAMLAAGMGAFAPAALILLKLCKRDGIRVPYMWRYAAGFSILGYLLLSFAQGSRSVLLATILAYYLAIGMLEAGRPTGPKSNPVRLYGLVMLLLLVVISVSLMLKRLEEMGIDPVTSLRFSGYAEAVQPPEWVYQIIEQDPDAGAVIAAALSLVLYAFHGFYEFSKLFADFSSPHTGGAMLFWLPAKIISIISGVPLSVDLESLNGVRVGIYTTFSGPVFIDFGWWALLVQIPLFVALGLPSALLTAHRNDLWLPASAAVGAVLVMYPVINFLDSSAGLYPIVTGLLVPLMGVRSNRRRQTATGRPEASKLQRLSREQQPPRLGAH